MTTPLDAATARARALHDGTAPSIRAAARQIGDAAWAAADPRAAEALRAVDAEFDARVAPFERPAGEPAPRRVRTVTPWPDIVALFAAASVLGSALGAGRITGGSWLESDPVVAWTVIVSAALAIVLVVAGVVFAHRERSVLRAQRTQSSSVFRAGLSWATLGIATIGAVGMVVRVVQDPLPLSIVALVCAVLLVALTVPVALGAQREAQAGAARGKLIPRGGDSSQQSRNELLSASEDAQDRAAEAVAAVDLGIRDDVDEAYAAGVAALVAGGGLPKTTVDRLRKADPFAARYDV